jgi:Protein of unknown function (DUF2846)
MLNTFKSLSILSAGLLLAACASGPKYSDMKSSIAPLAANQGRVYFYRSNSMAGAAIQPSIMLNGEKIGDSQPGGFFYVDRPPGSYEALCGTEVERKASFVLSAGQERYIKTTISMGFMAGHVTPELVDPSEGMAAIQSLHYAPQKSAQK